MPKSILEIPGIGEWTAKNLALHGFRSANDLAATTTDKLIAVQGFSNIRAAQIIQAAKDLLDVAVNNSGKTQQKKSVGTGKSKKEQKSKKDKKKSSKKKHDKKKSKSKSTKIKKSSSKKKKKK